MLSSVFCSGNLKTPSEAKGVRLKLAKESRVKKGVFTNRKTHSIEHPEKVWGPACFYKMPDRTHAKWCLPQTRILRGHIVTVSDMRTILEGDSLRKGRIFVVMGVGGTEVEERGSKELENAKVSLFL